MGNGLEENRKYGIYNEGNSDLLDRVDDPYIKTVLFMTVQVAAKRWTEEDTIQYGTFFRDIILRESAEIEIMGE